MVPWLLLPLALGWQDGRPAMCDGGDAERASAAVGAVQSRGLRAGNLWERAKAPAVAPYCARIASVIANLSNPTPEGVAASLKLLTEADALLPAQGITNGLRAWALFEQGNLGAPTTSTNPLFLEGYAAMKRAEQADPKVGDEPRMALVFARLAAATQRRTSDESLLRYERVLGLSARLPARLRAATYFEAGVVALTAGPGSLPRAIAVLREGLRGVGSGYEVATQFALAFALGVADRTAEGLLLERVRGNLEQEALASLASLARADEADALRAMSSEARDPAAAKALWALYSEHRGPWEAYARSREARLAGKRKAAP